MNRILFSPSESATVAQGAPVTPSRTQTVILTAEKDCKHSVRYATKQPDVAVDNLYLSRKFAGGGAMPQVIEVTVTAK